MNPPLEQVMRQHGDSVYAAAYSLLKNKADAEDAVQDTFLKYYERTRAFASEEHLRAWLLRSAINRAKDLLRAASRKNCVPLEDAPPQAGAFPSPESRELFAAVLALPEQYRTVIHLHYYEDYSVQEIAGLLHLTGQTVKTRLYRGRQLLRAEFEGGNNDERA